MPLLAKLIVLFTVVPLAELAILLKVGSVLGNLTTILIVVFTGILGATLAKLQGLRVFPEIRKRIYRGEIPAGELFDGALILGAGLLLMTPGLITDALGFFLLIPRSRSWLKGWLRRKAERMIAERRFQVHIDC